METLETFVVAQLKEDEPPAMMDKGDASKEQVGAGFGGMASVASQITDPPEPVAVILYECVSPAAKFGLKLCMPSKGRELPTAGEAVVGTMMTDVAFVEVQSISLAAK